MAQSPKNHNLEDIIERISEPIKRIPTRVEPSMLESRVDELEKIVKGLRMEVEEIKNSIGI